MTKKGVRNAVITCAIIMSIITVLAWAILAEPWKEPELSEKIFTICETNDSIKISDITDFEWDIAYIDKQAYGTGQELQEKGIEGNFQKLETDCLCRVAFCKGNKMVYELILNESYVFIDDSITEITQETILLIKKKIDEYGEHYELTLM